MKQSNSANLSEMTTNDLAAVLGQLSLRDCESHRPLVLSRLPAVTDQATPTVVLLRMLGNLATEPALTGPDVPAEPRALGDDAAFAR